LESEVEPTEQKKLGVPEYKHSIESNSIQPSSCQYLFLSTLDSLHDPARGWNKPLQNKGLSEQPTLLGDPPAEIDPDKCWLLPQNGIERPTEHAEPNVDTRRGQERADLHSFLSFLSEQQQVSCHLRTHRSITLESLMPALSTYRYRKMKILLSSRKTQV
jgi:hypothetical protein